MADALAVDDGVRIWGTWYLIFYIASAVTFLAWLSRAIENAPPLRAGTPERSPREGIGWWFVPFACWVVPYQIVRDLFERLATSGRGGAGGRVLAWWILFVFSAFFALVGSVLDRAVDPTLVELKNSVAVWIVSDLVDVIGLCFALWLIHEMQMRANTRAATLGLSPEGVPVWPAAPQPVAPAPSLAAMPVPATTHEMKACPRCAEDVRAAALVCRFCGFDFSLDPADLGQWAVRACMGPLLVPGTTVSLSRPGPTITLAAGGRSYWLAPASETEVVIAANALVLSRGEERIVLEPRSAQPLEMVGAALRRSQRPSGT